MSDEIEPSRQIAPRPERPAAFHPSIIAAGRRREGDVNQFAWDAEPNPKIMVGALFMASKNTVLLPVARFMESTTSLARQAHGGRQLVSQGTMIETMRTAARLLRNGNIDGAIDFMMPIRRLVTPGGTVEDIRKLFADVVRDLYPAAPITYKAPEGFVPPPLPALPDDGMGTPLLQGDVEQ